MPILAHYLKFEFAKKNMVEEIYNILLLYFSGVDSEVCFHSYVNILIYL